MDYMLGQYSISKIDTPLLGKVLTFSRQQDFLALAVEFIPNDEEEEMFILDDEVIKAIFRIFSVMNKALPSKFIIKNIMREVIYYILCGSCNKQFLQNIVNIVQADKIYKANSWIKENFRNSFTVENLAEQRNMSVSLFHQRFKSAVGMGPLQCQKRLRLTEARRLMLDENKNVTEASVDVGYESVSQFTMHNKGCTPCISKNLRLKEIPNCFFNIVENADNRMGDTLSDFAKLIMKNEQKLS